MKKQLKITILLLALAAFTRAQSVDILRKQVQQIVASKNAVVGVQIIGNNDKDTLTLNGERHYPLQSVFKFHIGLVILSEVDKGKLALDQQIEIRKQDLLPGLYSPLQDKYPNGAKLPLSEILRYTVSASDNVGCDVLLRLLGGPAVVESYFKQINIRDISIKINEKQQQSRWEAQFSNWTTPAAANQVLSRYYYNTEKLLSDGSYNFIWQLMRDTETGRNRIRGQLPAQTVVAHKTGSSGANAQGLTAAVNDIGIVFLPGGQHFFISVFVTDSKESTETNEKIIADIAKAAWDYFSKKAE
jgi:beta-lactamase class A/beta-lactamase class A VEB